MRNKQRTSIRRKLLTVNVNNDVKRDSNDRFCNHEEKILLHRDKHQKWSCYMSKEESFGVLTVNSGIAFFASWESGHL